MIGAISFGVCVVGVMMSFFENLLLPSFIIAIVGIIISILSAYYKDEKELKDKDAKKDSRALEVGAIILAGATCVSYFVNLIIK